MSNDAIQPIDEISPALPKEFEECVVDIGDRLHNQFSHIPTQSLQASIDNNCEEKPSIFHDLDVDPVNVFSYSRGLLYSNFYVSYKTTGWQFLAFMTQWFGLNVRSYLQYMQEKEDLAWGYYAKLRDQENRSHRRKNFLELLLLNSCILIFAIVLFQNVRNGVEILSGTKEKWSDPSDQRSREFYILYQYIMKDLMGLKCDMLDMGCQIPWFVVEAVYTKHSNLSKLVDTPINKLAFSCFDDLYPGVHQSKVNGGTGTLPPGGFKHLLHIFHWTRTPQGKYLVETKSLELVKNMDSFYIPSVTELQLSATVFEKHAGSSIDVDYYDKRLSGVMQLAPWHLFPYNIQIYKDLLTFERRYMRCGFPVTAYVACMVRLLQTKADVRQLRANGIVPITGNDEKDVLSFVQEFKTVLTNDVCMPNDLNILSKKVRAHHERSSSRSYVQFKSRYFANPWVTISVVAGICLFVLTFIQTVYSMLSYYKQ